MEKLMATVALMVISLLVFTGCGASLTTPETCEDLAPMIIELSEDNEGPFSGRIIKLYEIDEVRGASDRVIDCKANAKWSRGGDSGINFYMEEDSDGDRFIGYERE